jgi:hypothetical protein
MAFSVAAGSTGHPLSMPPISPMYPNVALEGPLVPGGDGSVLGDIYSSYEVTGVVPGSFGAYPAVGPAAPCVPIHDNIQAADEDGMPPFAPAPNVGLGLVPLADELDTLEMLDNGAVDFLPPGGDTLPDAPIFFSVDAATAAALGVLPPAGLVTPGSILVFDPVAGVIFHWAGPAMLGLMPGDDIDALTVEYTSGAPLAGGWIGPPDSIVFSLAPGSPSLPLLPTMCFGVGPATAGDIWAKLIPGPALPVPVLGAEMMGLNTLRSGGAVNDNVDAIDIVLASGIDGDGDFIDDAVDLDDDNDGLGDMSDIAAGCSPMMADTDGDGLSDYAEVVTLGTNCALIDTDLDGCADSEEPGPDETLGGLRDPLNFWDFFDVWQQTAPGSGIWVRDQVVDVDEIFAIVARIFTVGVPGDPLIAPAAKTTYHSDYDRTFAGPDPWDLGPADGVIAIDEIFWAAAQFAHGCAAPP